MHSPGDVLETNLAVTHRIEPTRLSKGRRTLRLLSGRRTLDGHDRCRFQNELLRGCSRPLVGPVTEGIIGRLSTRAHPVGSCLEGNFFVAWVAHGGRNTSSFPISQPSIRIDGFRKRGQHEVFRAPAWFGRGHGEVPRQNPQREARLMAPPTPEEPELPGSQDPLANPVETFTPGNLSPRKTRL